MKRFAVAVISIMLIFLPLNAQSAKSGITMQEIHEKYPDAEIKVVTLDEYEDIKNRYKNSDIIYIADANRPEKISYESNETNATKSDTNSSWLLEGQKERVNKKMDSDINYHPKSTKTKQGTSIEHGVNVKSNVNLELPDMNVKGDAAVVVFIVIGVIIVAVLVVYAGKYIYDVIKSEKKYDYWVDSSINYTAFSSDYSKNSGNMMGYKIASGFKDGRIGIGASAEAGFFGFSFGKAEDAVLSDYEGSYLMAGPYIKFMPGNEVSLFMEMLGGKSNLKEIDTVAVARVGLKGEIGDNLVAGVSYGAIYVGMNESEGIANDVDNYEIITTVEIGYRF